MLPASAVGGFVSRDKRTTVSTVDSDSKGNSFTFPPSIGIGKLKTMFFIQQPSFLFSGYRSIICYFQSWVNSSGAILR